MMLGWPLSPDDSGEDGLWLWGLPFLIIAWSVLAVLWDPAVVPWQPVASRRLVPVVLPGLVLFAIWVSSWLTSRAAALGASRAALAAVGVCCVLALALPPLVTTLNPGLSNSANSSASSGASKLTKQVQLRGVGAPHGPLALRFVAAIRLQGSRPGTTASRGVRERSALR